MKQRKLWVDIAKGIAIILVVFAHSLSGDGRVFVRFIYSFHMPFFFTVSSYTYHYSKSMLEYKNKCKKSAKHLLLPAVLLEFFLWFLSISEESKLLYDKDYWIHKLYEVLFASGCVVSVGNVNHEIFVQMGLPWFFFVLFFSRAIYDFLQMRIQSKENLTYMCIIITFIGVILGLDKNYLILSLDAAFAVVSFMMLGDYLKKWNFQERNRYYCFLFTSIWILTNIPRELLKLHYSIGARLYPLFPLCWISAIAGTMMFFQFFGRGGRSVDVVMKPLQYLGQYSLYYLCIHCVDRIWKEWYIVENHMYLSAGLRIICDLIIFLFVMFLRRCYLYVNKGFEKRKMRPR